jgi:hypothetical protein
LACNKVCNEKPDLGTNSKLKLHSPNIDVKTISLPKWNINTKNSYMKYNNDREDRKDRLLLKFANLSK